MSFPFPSRLPPIEDRWTSRHSEDCFLNRGFAFQCPAWKACKFEERVLKKVVIAGSMQNLHDNAMLDLILATHHRQSQSWVVPVEIAKAQWNACFRLFPSCLRSLLHYLCSCSPVAVMRSNIKACCGSKQPSCLPK